MSIIISARRCCRCCCAWHWRRRGTRGRSRRRQGRRDGRRRHNSPAEAGDGGGRIAHIGRTLGPHHRDVACIVRAVISGRRAGLRRGGQGCSRSCRGTQRSCDGTVRDAFSSIAVRGDGVGGRRSHRWPTDGTGGRRPLFGRLDQEVQSTAVHALCPATGRNSAQRWHACNRSGQGFMDLNFVAHLVSECEFLSWMEVAWLDRLERTKNIGGNRKSTCRNSYVERRKEETFPLFPLPMPCRGFVEV